MDYYQSRHENAVSVKPIWEGNCINLGSYSFEVILVPGHTPGSIVLMEKNRRFLIGGDSMQSGPIYMFGNGRNFEAYLSSMKKLQSRIPEFDTIYSSHGELVLKPEIIFRLHDVAEQIMEKKLQGTPETLWDNFTMNCYRTDGVAFYAL